MVAATQIEAHQLAEQFQRHGDFADEAASILVRISFTALAWNQQWPEQPVDELHWLCTNAQMPAPAQDISARAAIVHVHYLAGEQPSRHPGMRTYVWRDMDELVRFWATFHRAQAMCNTLGLDWRSYEQVELSGGICQSATGWGATRVAAVSALLNDASPELYPSASNLVLLVEADHDISFGDWASLSNHVEDVLGIPVHNLLLFTTGYQGYGLNLMVLGEA